MPDIDIDVQSDRRDELIRYVERTYGEQHAAMVANIITYRPRLALRDTAKALGFPMTLVNRLTKVLPHYSDPSELCRYHYQLLEVLRREGALDEATRRRCEARLPLALQLATQISGLPRHLSLHNGGMVLTRDPLSSLLPVRLSANGVRALEVDKDDVERLGLIKFDLLGLRTLGAIEEALTLIEETTGVRPDIDHLPTAPPDPATMRLIRAGQTLAVFQIESPGQWHLLAETQPQTFDDLIVQTALFRPGPLQAHMVHPYITRRQESWRQQEKSRQRDAVQTPWRGTPADGFWTKHPVLGPILEGSEGILLFQEQILEIAHQFAGLSYAEADGFRRAMSHQRTGDQMEAMHRQFVAGARAGGETDADAERVFAAIGHYVGYGFCKSHAAEFARTIYATAWLKAHYPAQYLAAFLSSQPAGFFPPYTVLEEAKLLGLAALPPDVNRSEDRFSVEQVGPPGRERWAIRIGLRQIGGVGEEFARTVLWARRTGSAGGKVDPVLYPQYQERPFRSLQDLCIRLRPQGLTMGIAEALVLSGACDALAPRMGRRQRLWQLREIWPLVHPTHYSSTRRAKGNSQRRNTASPASAPVEEIEQLPLAWEDALALPPPSELPRLPGFDREEKLALDYQLLGLSAGVHPMRLVRRQLQRQGIQAVTELAGVPAGQMARVAGRVISAARPPTANGMGFLVLEDETGRLPVTVPPQLANELHQLLLKLREARGLVALGRVERVRWYYSLLAYALWTFPASEGMAAAVH